MKGKSTEGTSCLLYIPFYPVPATCRVIAGIVMSGDDGLRVQVGARWIQSAVTVACYHLSIAAQTAL